MKNIYPTTQFRKDLKKYSNNRAKMEALHGILDKLRLGQPIPKENQAYPLKGNYKGYMECHIGADFLLIWMDGDQIQLVRLGSHSELFGKKN